jgi:F-type H+-transporting ATPase subunit gamma
MLSTQDIQRHIRSISGTAKITGAMQMVAASKMRRAQQAALAGRPFISLLYRVQRAATGHAADGSHPLLQVREVRRRAIILVAADKGLCGALNSNVFRLAEQFESSSTVYITAGRMATQFVARSGRQLAAEFTCGDHPQFSEARKIAELARDLFEKGEVDEVRIVATRFVNTLVQQPACLEFLPVGEIQGLKIEGAEPAPDPTSENVEFQFEPNSKTVIGYLLKHYLNIYVYQVLLNAKASEHSARMVSMKGATENADHLIKSLTLQYNKLRQENITNELLDIAGGQA